MDFIVKLPLSSGFDSILVIVDHFSKGAHFIPCKESMDSSALASLFISHFFRHHGLPDKIVTDRGPTFVSAFWTTVQKALRIHSAPSTAYHPQTDGQTERTNHIYVISVLICRTTGQTGCPSQNSASTMRRPPLPISPRFSLGKASAPEQIALPLPPKSLPPTHMYPSWKTFRLL